MQFIIVFAIVLTGILLIHNTEYVQNTEKFSGVEAQLSAAFDHRGQNPDSFIHSSNNTIQELHTDDSGIQYENVNNHTKSQVSQYDQVYQGSSLTEQSPQQNQQQVQQIFYDESDIQQESPQYVSSPPIINQNVKPNINMTYIIAGLIGVIGLYYLIK